MPKLDHCSTLEAELWGIYHGINIAWSRGFRNLIVESDSVDAIEALCGGHGGLACSNPIVRSTLEIGIDELQVNWKWIGRGINSVADKLPKSSYEIRDTCVIFDYLPDFLVSLYYVDNLRLSGPSMS